MDAHVSSAAFSPARTEVSGSFSSSQGHWNTLWNSSPPLESDNPWNYPTSDPEFSNVSSPEAISPTSCVMDYSSPKSAMMNVHPAAVITGQGEGSSPSPRAASSSSSSSCEENGYPSSSSSNSGGAQRSKRKTRSRNPSRQRQCASEKEKLRMRDLTKALHHLRSYLPASVAPAGQTLTKIQTLRYTIRYIAHLSAQVETRDELQASGGQQSLYAPQGGFPEQQSERLTLGGCWDAFTQNTGGTDAKQAPWQRGSDLPAYHGPHSSPYDSTYEDLFNSSTDSMMQSPVYTTGAKQSYQEYDRDMTFHTISPDYWI